MFRITGAERLPKTHSIRSRMIGVLLCSTTLAATGCGLFPAQESERPTGSRISILQRQTYEPCTDDQFFDKLKGGFAIRAAEHNNRITTCVLIPANVNLAALDQLRIEAQQERRRSANGNPSATAILAKHYKDNFDVPVADTPEAARDALVDGGSFRDVTDKIDSEDLPYLPGGLFVVGTDTSGDVDFSISLGSNSQPHNEEHDGRAGLLNSDGLTDSQTPIDEGRLNYVLAPIGKSYPNGKA